MSKKDELPKELRIERRDTGKRFYDKPVYPTRYGRKKNILGPLITFAVLTAVILIYFKGHLEVAIVVIATIFLALMARWFFGR